MSTYESDFDSEAFDAMLDACEPAYAKQVEAAKRYRDRLEEVRTAAIDWLLADQAIDDPDDGLGGTRLRKFAKLSDTKKRLELAALKL